MKKFTIFMREDGETEVRSEKTVEKYDLSSTRLGNYDWEEFEEEFHIKSDTPIIENDTVYEIWHCFKLLDYFNKGYWRHQRVEYLRTEKRSRIDGEIVKVYQI